MISVKKNKQLGKQEKKQDPRNIEGKENFANDYTQFKKLPKRIQEMPKTIHFINLNPGLQ